MTVLLLIGCSSQRTLMPTPEIYALGIEQPFPDSLSSELKTADAAIMYITDRLPSARADGRLDYGLDRSHTVMVGEAVVKFGDEIGWQELADDARTSERSTKLGLTITSVREKAQGPRDSLFYYQADGSLVGTAEGTQALMALTSTVHDMIRDRLHTAPRKEVLVFVHGVANSFDDALYATAELWHYLGREFVPIAYSWPAGQGGLLRGYTYDRESSEFTVFHFKRFLAWMAELPEVEAIHIISHSRGTDVVLTSIRELTIEARAQGNSPQQQLKLGNVVIAAPDINIEVAMQRTEREGTRWAAERWTTYTSSGDKAIGISEWLFGGGRFGKVDYDNVDRMVRTWMDNFAHMESANRDAVIQYQGKRGGSHGHDYFRTNPAVSSDLVLTVRFGRQPGAENGRPLEHVDALFWRINDDYLRALEEQ